MKSAFGTSCHVPDALLECCSVPAEMCWAYWYATAAVTAKRALAFGAHGTLQPAVFDSVHAVAVAVTQSRAVLLCKEVESERLGALLAVPAVVPMLGISAVVPMLAVPSDVRFWK